MIVLTAMTWVTGMLDIQYQSDKTLAFENGFPGDITDWHQDGDAENLSLSSDAVTIQRHTSNRSYAIRTFTLPDSAEIKTGKLRIRGIIKTLTQASPLEKDHVAAFMIWFRGANDDVVQYLTVQALTGDFPEYRAERIVSIPDTAQAFSLVMINRESNGAFALTDASVAVVGTTPLYGVIGLTLVILWSGLALVAMLWLFRTGGAALMTGLTALVTLTVAGTVLPESITSNQILPLYQALIEALKLSHAEPLGIVYKVGHFLFFFAATLLGLLNYRRLEISMLSILLFMFILAVATEGLQLHLFNRSTRLSDIGIDSLGITLAWLIALTILTQRKDAR